MTTATTSNPIRDSFIEAAAFEVNGAIGRGRRTQEMRMMIPYIEAALSEGASNDIPIEETFAFLLGEYMLSSDEYAAAFAKVVNEVKKFNAAKELGADPRAFVELAKDGVGLYQKNKEGALHHVVSQALVTARGELNRRDQAWKLQSELGCAADKFNGLMNKIATELGLKEGKKGKGGRGNKNGKPSPEETTPDKLVNEVCNLSKEDQLKALELLVQAMLIDGIDRDDIESTVVNILLATPSQEPAVAA